MRAELYPASEWRRRLTAATVVWLAMGPLATPSEGQERRSCLGGAPGAPSVFIDSAASEVTVVTPDGVQVSASRNLLLCPGDEVRTGATGRVAIRFDEKRTVIRLDGNSRTRVLSGGTGSADVSLMSGLLYFVSSVRRHFEVDTPYIVAGIDGTEALVAVRPADALAIAAVREGLVSAYDHAEGRGSEVKVAGGEAAYRSASVPFQAGPIGSLPPPFRELLIVSESAVDWAVYYPPILLARDPGNAAIRRAVTLLSSGDYEQAERSLDAAGSSAATAALRTIIAISRNRIAEAERWSALALQTGADAAAALVAASYVRQATGDLEGALRFARSAAAADPGDAYALARLAELQMIVGDRRAALANAERTLTIARLPLALFVAGLARLAASQYEAAEALFEEAIALDPEAPLPRLGLGLAYIRRGRTAAGTWELERAVIHDPRRAALRTWLGRAYFDEELEAKAAEELRIAELEDPEDPTPYLFSALRLYAANRPIPALRELQEAEKRGEARSVLRSAQGLGEDAATRGAAMGRIYDVLAFKQLAIQAGSEAVDADPSNPGAHRFLADAYRQRPGSDIAQASELLRSQLLAPPSKTPVQPELSEAHLALLDTPGPARVTFAELAPLFDADGFRIDASGMVGTQQTWSDTAAVTGLYRWASLSIGQYHYETDGFRANNDLKHDIVDGIATLALSPEFSLFGEFRRRDSEGGDRRLNFDLDDFDPTFRSDVTHEIARVGFHARPTASSDLLGLYTGATLTTDDSITVSPSLGDIETTARDEADSGQLQYIRDDGVVRSETGGAFIHNDRETGGSIFGTPSPVTGTDIDYYNGYTYFHVDLPAPVTWTLGASATRYASSDGAQDIFTLNPKLGVVAALTEDIKLRASYLRNVKPDLVAEDLIEPTAVSGFNQSYDGFNGAVLEQYGAGADIALGARAWIGGEALQRNWDVPVLGVPDRETVEKVVRGYGNLILTDNLALAAEIVHERSHSDAPFDFSEWRTTSFPVTLSYFAEWGVFGFLQAEYVDHAFSNPGIDGADTFGLVSAGLGYRLPQSRGIVSIEVQNLFDERFDFQNRSIRPDLTAAPRFAPERTIMARGTIKY